MEITYALMEKLEELAETDPKRMEILLVLTARALSRELTCFATIGRKPMSRS